MHKILPLSCIYVLNTLYIVKINLYKFGNFQQVHRYPKRGKHLHSYPSHRTTAFEKSPFDSGIKLFNELADHIMIVQEN